jgi:hypothetical protein
MVVMRFIFLKKDCIFDTMNVRFAENRITPLMYIVVCLLAMICQPGIFMFSQTNLSPLERDSLRSLYFLSKENLQPIDEQFKFLLKWYRGIPEHDRTSEKLEATNEIAESFYTWGKGDSFATWVERAYTLAKLGNEVSDIQRLIAYHNYAIYYRVSDLE